MASVERPPYSPSASDIKCTSLLKLEQDRRRALKEKPWIRVEKREVS